jgi:hypothetical protein
MMVSRNSATVLLLSAESGDREWHDISVRW